MVCPHDMPIFMVVSWRCYNRLGSNMAIKEDDDVTRGQAGSSRAICHSGIDGRSQVIHNMCIYVYIYIYTYDRLTIYSIHIWHKCICCIYYIYSFGCFLSVMNHWQCLGHCQKESEIEERNVQVIWDSLMTWDIEVANLMFVFAALSFWDSESSNFGLSRATARCGTRQWATIDNRSGDTCSIL